MSRSQRMFLLSARSRRPGQTRTGRVRLCPGLMRYPTFSICAAHVCRGVRVCACACVQYVHVRPCVAVCGTAVF
eukprot:8560839-Pyramimonas_sp.AAC.1